MAENHQQKLEPSDWVRQYASLVPEPGRVLDLACGGGRHGRLFLQRGHPVTLLDRDVDEIADLSAEAGVEIIAADLEDGSPWPLAGRSFAAIVITNYLHRPLFPYIVECLAPGGLLIYETFAKGNEKLGRPRNPAFLLNPAELLDAFAPRLTIMAYEHAIEEEPTPAVRQRICAINGSEPARRH